MRIINGQLIKKMIQSQQKNGHLLRKFETAAGTAGAANRHRHLKCRLSVTGTGTGTGTLI